MSGHPDAVGYHHRAERELLIALIRKGEAFEANLLALGYLDEVRPVRMALAGLHLKLARLNAELDAIEHGNV